MSKLLPSLLRSASAVSPRLSPKGLVRRGKMVQLGLKHKQLVEPIVNAHEGCALDTYYNERPDLLGVLLWPYVNAAWGPAERLKHATDHYHHLDQIGAPFPFSIDERLVVHDMGELYPGLRLVLDQPQWFKREGGLTLNLFVDQFRAYSVAFNYWTDEDGARCILIGSLQGRNTEDALGLYRDLTKAMHGMRPRDMLLHALRLIGNITDAEKMFGIANAYRHHQHPYFGGKKVVGDYDEIWVDRSGEKVHDHFYQLPMTTEPRDISTIKPKKRSLYRKRFAFLEAFDEDITQNFKHCTPVRFKDL